MSYLRKLNKLEKGLIGSIILSAGLYLGGGAVENKVVERLGHNLFGVSIGCLVGYEIRRDEDESRDRKEKRGDPYD